MVLYDGDYFILEQLEESLILTGKSCEVPLLRGKRLNFPQTITGLILKVYHNAITKNDSSTFKSLGHLLIAISEISYLNVRLEYDMIVGQLALF